MRIFRVKELSVFSIGESQMQSIEAIEQTLRLEYSTLHYHSESHWLNEGPHKYRINCLDCESSQDVYHMEWDAITCDQCGAIIENYWANPNS